MKYLKSYNESLRDLMTPKSEDEIMKSLKGLDNSEILKKSIDNEFIKGVKIALQHKLTDNNINFIKYKIGNINNKEIVRLLLNKVSNNLTENQIYIIEKYKLGLHQNEEKDYEIWFKELLTDLDISRSKEDVDELIYKKDGKVLYYYNEKYKDFYIDYYKIWLVFKEKFQFNNNEIRLLTKGMVEEHLNLMGITIPFTEGNDGYLMEEHLNLMGITMERIQFRFL
jgi:hypothetical protein